MTSIASPTTADTRSGLALLGERRAVQMRERLGDDTEGVREALAVPEAAGEFVAAFRNVAGLSLQPGRWEDLEATLAKVVVTAYTAAHALRIDLDDAIADQATHSATAGRAR